MALVSSYGNPESESEARKQSLDGNKTARTLGGRRMRFEPDDNARSVCLLVEDGEAGPGGTYCLDREEAETLFIQLKTLL